MMTILLILLALGAVFFVARPLLARSVPPFDPTDDRTRALQHLVERKKKVYNDIRDLDFEFGIGKMADQDYHALRKDCVNEAARILQRIDSLQNQSNGAGKVTDEYLEKLIRSKKSQLADAGTVVVQTGDDILVCPSCQFNNNVNAKFCSECGTRLVKD